MFDWRVEFGYNRSHAFPLYDISDIPKLKFQGGSKRARSSFNLSSMLYFSERIKWQP
jgi:hypothetical protein